MGNADTKLNFRKAVVHLTSKSQVKCLWTVYSGWVKFREVCVPLLIRFLQPIDAAEDRFWDQFWSESVTNVQDVFALVPGAEIRALREEAPNNLATLVYKAVEKLVKTVDSSCRTQKEQLTGKFLLPLVNHILLLW